MKSIQENTETDFQENELDEGIVSLGEATVLTKGDFGNMFEFPHKPFSPLPS